MDCSVSAAKPWASTASTFRVVAGPTTTTSAGKYLSDKVFLEVPQGITPGSGKAKLGIELTPRISAETQIGQQGQTRSSLT